MVENNNFLSFSGTKKTTLCNNKRLARTWLDEFEILYNFTLSSVSLKEDCGIPEKMLKIKKELKCKPFHWYLQNVYPELTVSILFIVLFLKIAHSKKIFFLKQFSNFIFQMPAEGDIAFGQIHSKPLTGFLHCLDHVGM